MPQRTGEFYGASLPDSSPRLRLRSAVDYRGYCPSESLYLRVWLYMICWAMSEAGAMKCESPGAVTVSRRLAKAIPELRRLQNLLLAGENLDPRILTDFRDALNHVRNTAWSAHQYIASESIDHDSASVLSVY